MQRIADNQVQSLNSSGVNGGIPISKRLLKLLLAAEGKNLSEGNGMKPVIAMGGWFKDSILGKGFMYYHPDIKFPVGVEMLIPESVAKTYTGKSMNGVHNISPLRIEGKFQICLKNKVYTRVKF